MRKAAAVAICLLTSATAQAPIRVTVFAMANGDFAYIDATAAVDTSVSPARLKPPVPGPAGPVGPIGPIGPQGIQGPTGPAGTSGPTRHYGALLTYSATAAGWPLPIGATSVAIYVNGLRYTETVDYQISSGTAGITVTPKSSNMLPEHTVIADYNQ